MQNALNASTLEETCHLISFLSESDLRMILDLVKRLVGQDNISRYEQSIRDVEAGNVNEYQNAEDFFMHMGIEA